MFDKFLIIVVILIIMLDYSDNLSNLKTINLLMYFTKMAIFIYYSGKRMFIPD